MASATSHQALRRWGNSLGVRLPVAIAREAHLLEDQQVELSVVKEGVLIRPLKPRLTLDERLTTYRPMETEPIEAMAWEPIGSEVQRHE